MKKYILITGVAGLIGSNFARWVKANIPDYEIIGIDSLLGGVESNIPDFVRFYKKDLAKDNISRIFEKYKPEYVFHFAAYAAEGLSPFIRKFNYENNVVSTAAIVNECIKHNVRRLVYTSSMSVYGRGVPPFKEKDLRQPIDPYGVSKAACEMDIEIAGEQHNLDYCILRPHNVYGPGQNIWDPYRNVLGIWMWRVLHDESIRVYGDGNQTRAFTYVGDIMMPLWFAAIHPQASKRIINLGQTPPVSLNEAAETLEHVVRHSRSHHHVVVVHEEPRHEVKEAYPDGRLSQVILGFENRTSLAEGLTAMWEWAKCQPAQRLQLWDEYELDKGIYSYWDLKK